MKRSSFLLLAACGLGAAALALLSAPPARACGGFFLEEVVSGTAHVDQSAVRLIFEMGEGEITANVQVGYQGDADGFAWVIPVASLPTDIDVASTEMFEQLDLATAPRFTTVHEDEGAAGGGCGCGSAGGDKAGGLGDESRGNGVTVWSRQNVGPFATEVVSSDDPDALRAWLVAGGYAIPEAADQAIAAYVATGSFFLAMRLQDTAAVEDLSPIRFRYQGTQPCVPLRMDAISAPDDMQLLVWVFAQDRVVPANWVQTEPDWSRLEFDEETSNYLELVSAAADATGGQSFVTEYSGETRFLGGGGEFSEGVAITDPELVALQGRRAHVTRLFTVVSPAEMTNDPTFRLDDGGAPVSNEHTWYASLGSVPGRGAPDETATAFAVAVAGVGWRWRRRRRPR